MEAVARTVSETLGFKTVVVNLYRSETDDYRVEHRPRQRRGARGAAGKVTSRASWTPLLEPAFLRARLPIPAGTFDSSIDIESADASAQTLASLVQPVRLNSGGTAYTSMSGAPFAADGSFAGGSTYAITQAISGTNDPALYQNERWGQFTYTIAVPNGTYDVRMHFVELYYGTAVSGSCVGKRIFSIDVLNTTASPDIKNLDVCAAGGPRAAVVRTVTGVQVTNGSLSVKSVYGSVDDPEIAAIEVVPASSTPITADRRADDTGSRRHRRRRDGAADGGLLEGDGRDDNQRLELHAVVLVRLWCRQASPTTRRRRPRHSFPARR